MALALGLLALSVVLRIAVVLAWDNYHPVADAEHFDVLAVSLANGEGWGETVVDGAVGPTAFRAPLYPGVLAGVYVVFGDHSWTAARALNALLGVGIVALIGLIAYQIWSQRVALVAMAIAAVHPTLLLVGSPLALEPLLVVLSLAALASVLHHRQHPAGLVWPTAAGVLLGLGVLAREQALLLVPPLAWLLWRQARRSSDQRGVRSAAGPGVFALAAILVVLPWTLRNAMVMDALVPVSTSSGIGLAGTYNETALGDQEHPARWILPWEDPDMARIIEEHPHPTEVAIDKALRSEAIDVIRRNPFSIVRVAFWNTIRMLDLDGGAYSQYVSRFVPYPLPLTRMAVVASYLVGALAIAGAFARDTRKAPGAMWAIPLLLAVFMVTALPGSIRYRASLEPFLILVASVGLTAAADAIRRRAAKHPADQSNDAGTTGAQGASDRTPRA